MQKVVEVLTEKCGILLRIVNIEKNLCKQEAINMNYAFQISPDIAACQLIHVFLLNRLARKLRIN